MSDAARLKIVADGSRSPRTQAQTSVVVIAPGEAHRRALLQSLESHLAKVISEFTVYPNYNHLLAILDSDCDAFLIELDSNPEAALEIVETICSSRPAATVMISSSRHNEGLLMRSMRAGAREFLVLEDAGVMLADALARAAKRHADHTGKKTRGKVLLFWGAKGGSGTTTLAANFAIALRGESGEGVALLDLNPQLGDVAVLLDMKPAFTVADALRNPERIDEELVTNLAAKHESGISVMAAPDAYNSSIAADPAVVGKFVDVVRCRYPYVVVDAGIGLGTGAQPLFQLASTIYLVAQADIPALRSSQRFMAHLEAYGSPHVEMVLNRFEPRKVEFDEARLTNALGAAPRWKVPNDYAGARRAANTGAPLISNGSPVGRVLREMARAACGKPPDRQKKKGFSLFG